jgi:8-amino-7-oxononanoate synthase
LHHACQLQGIRQIRYRHNDLAHLRMLLEKYRDQPNPKFIVTETVFGMDGDMVDMPTLTELADTFDAFLYLDEAHATGLFGERGYGLGAGWIAQRGLAMGTFSKALGGSGAYIACSAQVRDYIVNRCTGFIYSTALSPYITGAAHAAWIRISQMAAMRTTLLTQAATLRQQLQGLGLNTGTSTSHIIPLILGDAALTMKWKRYLLEKGLLVSAIRPPTVPPHTSRLRIALNLKHSPAQIKALVQALQDCMQYV